MRNEKAGLDSALIFGENLASYVAGRVTDSDLAPDVVEAFHLQYPDLAQTTTFADHVRTLADDEAALAGFLAGVKGKVFELHAVDYLNSGNLPSGWHAELATSATQPGYDITVIDDHGQVAEVVQVKATAARSLIDHHIAAHPEVPDVVVPSELAYTDVQGAELHALQESSLALDYHVGQAADFADHDPSFGIPMLSIVAASMHIMEMQRRGETHEAMTEVAVARLGGAASAAIVTKALAAIGGPVALVGSVAARILWGRLVVEARESSLRQAAVSQAIQRGHERETAAACTTSSALASLSGLAERVRRNRERVSV